MRYGCDQIETIEDKWRFMSRKENKYIEWKNKSKIKMNLWKENRNITSIIFLVHKPNCISVSPSTATSFAAHLGSAAKK